MQKDRFYFIVVIFLSSIFYVSDNDVQDNENKMAFKGYSGGMMLHAGYAQSGLFSLYEDDEVISGSTNNSTSNQYNQNYNSNTQNANLFDDRLSSDDDDDELI